MNPPYRCAQIKRSRFFHAWPAIGLHLGISLATLDSAVTAAPTTAATPEAAAPVSNNSPTEPAGILLANFDAVEAHSWATTPDRSLITVASHTSLDDEGGGIFYVDKSDQVSAGDGGTVIVAQDGTRLKRILGGMINVRWFGAVGDGARDDTAAIRAAWQYCVTGFRTPTIPTQSSAAEVDGHSLFFPAGDYVFSGPSLTLAGKIHVFRIGGESMNSSRIRIQNGDYLIKTGFTSALSITGLQFYGGKGVLKLTNSGTNVQGVYVIRDCSFLDYTECAIGHIASDMPAWRIENNIFFGSSEWTSIGVALNGLTDNSVIRENQFQRNHYGIKINGGYNAYIQNNDFIRFTPPNKDVADIWIVPVTNPANQALVISENKFGNENLRATDFRILIAKENDAPGDFTSRPHSEQDLGDQLRGGLMQLRDNNFVGTANYRRGIIASYTSDLRYINSQNMFSGGYPAEIVQFLNPFTQTRVNTQNFHDASQFYDSTEALVPPLSKSPIGLTRDPWGNLVGSDSSIQYFTTGDDPAYERLLEPDALSSLLMGTAGKSSAADVYGNDRAVRLSWKKAGDYAQIFFNVKKPLKPVWIEFDLKQSADRTFKQLVVDIRPKSASGAIFRRTIRVPAEWQRVRLLWFPSLGGDFRLSFPDGLEPFQSGESEQFMIGRLHIYQAHEPVADGRLRGTAIELQSTKMDRATAPEKNVIFIDSADNALKIRLSDGTTKTIVTKP